MYVIDEFCYVEQQNSSIMPLSRRNYLKKGNQIVESDDEKKIDEDLFDKLLSSPMKQEVSFQPLSFWQSKVKTHGVKKKTKKNPCWLYESSDSDDSSLKSPAACGSEPNWSISESESSENQTLLENAFQSQSQLSNTCITDLKIENISASSEVDVKLVTDKINKLKLSSVHNSQHVLSETENSQASEEDLTINNLTETSLFLDSRLVTKRRKYNFSNSNISPRASPSDTDDDYLRTLIREFQCSDESFVSDSKIFASTSQCHIPDETGISPFIRNRQVAVRKRHESGRRFSQTSAEAEESFECPRISSSLALIDSSLTSIDVEGQSQTNQSEDSVLEDSQTCTINKVILKPGKNWRRSLCVLKHYGDKSIQNVSFENTKVKGKKYKDFVESVLEMQSVNSRALNEISISNVSMNFNSSEESLDRIWEGEKSVNIGDFSRSVCQDTSFEKTFLNRTVKVVQPEDTPSAFRTALGLEQPEFSAETSFLEEENSEGHCISSVPAKDFILAFCNQKDILPFEIYFNELTLKDCKKIGEGVYGEVFLCCDTVVKIIPIEGSELVNDEKQKTFEGIISEVVIASKLSNLRTGQLHRTSAFSEMKKCWCVKGKYPDYLIQLWNEYDKTNLSDNDSPIMFKEDQLYVILALNNGGKDLESFAFKSARQSASVFIQIAFALAVAEKAFEFEHRDLHWGNVLVSKTDDTFVSAVLDGVEYQIPSAGVKACIIDFTLSRISHEGCSVYNNLSADPTLFAGDGDYQFDIYRMMMQEIKNDWSLFRPRNNLFWLHYMLDKMLTMVCYKNKKGKIHAKYLKELKVLEEHVLNFNDSTEFVMSEHVQNLIKQ